MAFVTGASFSRFSSTTARGPTPPTVGTATIYSSRDDFNGVTSPALLVGPALWSLKFGVWSYRCHPNYNSPMSQLANLIQSAADFLFVPVLVVVLFGTGLFLTLRLGVRAGAAVRRGGAGISLAAQGSGGAGVLTPFQAFMTALGDDDRHREHCGRRGWDRVGRTWRAVLDLVLRLLRDRDQVRRSGARRDFPRDARAGRHPVGPDVLPARRAEVAGARDDVRDRRRHRGADDDAVYADEFDRRWS